MKKTLTILLTLALAMVFAFTLVACKDKGNENGGKTDQTAEYTITFDSKGGSEVAGIKGKAGDEIKAPADPVKDGFEFSGWFESTNGGETLAENAFAFAYMPAKNVTLYAKWTELSVENKTYTQSEFVVKWESEEAKAKVLEGMGAGDDSMTEEEFLNFYNGINLKIVFSNDRFSVSAPGYPGGYSKSDLYYSIAENGIISVYLTAENKAAGTAFTGDGIFMNTFVISKDYKTIRMESPLPGTTECAIVLSVAK